MRRYCRGPRLDSTRLGSAPPTPAPAASRLSAALALPAKVHACILCGVHRIRCISKSRRNKSQKYRSRGPASTVRARPRESSRASASTDYCLACARARAIPIAERERQPGEGARRDKEGEEKERERKKRGETKGERRWSKRDRAVIKIERYIDDFSDALPRNRRSPLRSRTRRVIRDRKLATIARKGPPPKGGTSSARIRSEYSSTGILAVVVCECVYHTWIIIPVVTRARSYAPIRTCESPESFETPGNSLLSS